MTAGLSATVSLVSDKIEERPEQLRREAIRLSKPARAAALALGLAGLGSGGASVYLTHLEAGPVALIAAGLILAMVGLGGVLPTRVKFQDSELEFLEQRVAVALQRGVQDASPEARKDVAALVSRVADVAPEVAGPATDYLEYEDLVGSLTEALHQETDDVYLQLGLRTFSQIAVFAEGPYYSFGELRDIYNDFVMCAWGGRFGGHSGHERSSQQVGRAGAVFGRLPGPLSCRG